MMQRAKGWRGPMYDIPLHIVVGCSSAGKSTFIHKHLLPEITGATEGAAPSVEILFGGAVLRDLRKGLEPLRVSEPAASILHINSLLQFDQDPDAPTIDVERDPLPKAVLESGRPLHVHLCYAPTHVLLGRIGARELIEPELRDSPHAYPKERVLKGLSKVDQRQLLLRFAERLEPQAKDISIVFSTNELTSILSLDEFRFAPQTRELEQKIRP